MHNYRRGCFTTTLFLFIFNLGLALILQTAWNAILVPFGLPSLSFLGAYVLLIIAGFIYRNIP